MSCGGLTLIVTVSTSQQSPTWVLEGYSRPHLHTLPAGRHKYETSAGLPNEFNVAAEFGYPSTVKFPRDRVVYLISYSEVP